MWYKKIVLGLGLCSFCLFSCQSGKSQSVVSDTEGIIVEQDTISSLQFPFPEIPATLTEPEVRKSYLLTHYWERFDFADTTLVDNRDVTEQGFVNFIALLVDGTTSEELTRESLKNWCTGFIAKDHASRVLMKTADDYLYNPNSPFYNEGLYGVYLETLLDVFPTDDVQRSTYNFRLKLVKRNNPGDRATDFTYYLPDGNRCTLAATPVKGDRLLLVFYDPECESCHAVLGQMTASAALAKAVQTGRISVLAIYTEGNEEVWRKALPDMSEGWTIGADHEAVKTGALYDLKAMPSLYLLDGQKKVLLKDAAFEEISRFLEL